MSWNYVQKNQALGTGLTLRSLSVSLTGVGVGNLLCVSFGAYNTSSSTITCSDGSNIYTVGPTLNTGATQFAHAGCFWTQVTVGGALTVTISSATDVALTVGLTEFSLAPGMIVVEAGRASSQTDAPSSFVKGSGPITFSGTGHFLAWGIETDDQATAPSPDGGFTKGNGTISSPNYRDWCDEFALNKASSDSPIDVTFIVGGLTPTQSVCGLIFRESPAIVPRNGAPLLMLM